MNPIRWLRNHLRELLIVLLFGLLLLRSPGLIRLYDPTAGQLDGSVLQLIVWAGLIFLGGILLTWVGISAAFPTINRHLDSGQFNRDWTGLDAGKRATLTLWTLSLLLAFLAVCLLCAHLTVSPAVTPPAPVN